MATQIGNNTTVRLKSESFVGKNLYNFFFSDLENAEVEPDDSADWDVSIASYVIVLFMKEQFDSKTSRISLARQ